MLDITPPMRQYMFFEPLRFGTEFAYAILVTCIFLYLYLKTREMYAISGHQGIGHLKNVFLFFGIAHGTRFLYFVFRSVMLTTDFHIPGRVISFFSLILITYFSTIAVGHLIYSNIWRKVNRKTFLLAVHILAIISVAVFYLRYPLIFLFIIQFSLILILLLVNSGKNIKVLSSLLSFFWVLNLLIFHSRRILGFEFKVLIQIISLIILIYFTYRVFKWVK